ncbi:hypothetical protein NW760_015281 [Fusarium oxysporum]|nr:hypothetical protein NW769_015225 [Fusarium oxysporum]KAJ4212685.1 hypothetical protein NW760_015281 [Fusarium oxysporum]
MHEPGTGKGWFEKLKQTVFDADGEMPNCAQAGSGTCHVSSQVCYNLLRGVNPADPDGPKTGYKNARAYWILKSVETLHGVFGKIHEELVQNSAINTYDDIWGNLATSISFAGAYGIPNSGIFGFASGVLAIIEAFAQKEPEKPDGMTDLNEIVSTYFSGLSTTIQNILKDALGYGDQRNLPASTLTRTDGNVNQAAMFFEEGKWLFTNDDAMGSELDNIIEQSGSFVEQRLVMQAITRKNNFILIWNSRYGEPITEKYCKERKDACKTAIWKRDFEGGKCVELLDMEPCHREPRRPTKDWMNKATDKYGVDMKMVIDSAIECAFNDPHEPDFKSIEVGGGVPYCFFNLPVKRGKWVLGNRVARHPETHEKFKMSKWESLDEVYKP